MRLFATRCRHGPDRSVVAFLLLVHRHAHERHPRSIRGNLRIADPDKVPKIFFGNVALLREGDAESRSEDEQTNDEARITNDEGMAKPEARSPGSTSFCHLVIRYSFELCHSDFVIFAHSASLLLSTSPNFGENQMQLPCFRPDRSSLRFQLRHRSNRHA